MKTQKFRSTNQLFIIIFISIVAFSCFNPNKDVDIPEGIIPPGEMALIFRDIHLTDALISRKRLNINKNYLKINSYYKDIYEKHGYSRAVIDSSLNFYSSYPELMDVVYDQVLIELSKMEDTVATDN